MLNIEELQQRVTEVGLEKYWPVLEKLVRPAIYIDSSLSEDSNVEIGCSKSGGAPDAPPDFVWPCEEHGPRQFLAQINFSELSPFDIEELLPKSGLLSFFTDSNGIGGHGIPGECLVYYFTDVQSLQRHDFPEGYEGDDTCSTLSFYSGWSLPDTDEKIGFRWNTSDEEQEHMKYGVLCGLFSDDFENLESPSAREFPNLYGSHCEDHLLGHPDDYQGALEPQAEIAFRGISYPYEGTEEEKQEYTRHYRELAPVTYQDWICLLHNGGYCGGVFTIDYLIRREDLARADFSKTVAFAVN